MKGDNHSRTYEETKIDNRLGNDGLCDVWLRICILACNERVTFIKYLLSCRQVLFPRHHVPTSLPLLKCPPQRPSYNYCMCSTPLSMIAITHIKQIKLNEITIQHITKALAQAGSDHDLIERKC